MGPKTLTRMIRMRVYSDELVSTDVGTDVGPDLVTLAVGAGSAGAALAARLSEDGEKAVLLVEAGSTGVAVPFSHIPGLVPFNQRGPIDWMFQSVPQRNACRGLNDQVRKEKCRTVHATHLCTH